ncbi:glycoside hydrolase family 36 protein [Microbacterium sp. LWH3-1.2]|uniref:glycoside hydrolase family 36 protein n=1 Tax=Microbacterium sp. LWH3-1.2 TaxID=3135256 RepID=UPI00342A14FE
MTTTGTGAALLSGTIDLRWSDDQPAALLLPPAAFAGCDSVPLVEVFTAAEQRARTSQAYARSAVGARLRVTGVESGRGDGAEWVEVRQQDSRTGLQTRTRITRPAGVCAVRLDTSVRNAGTTPVTLTAVTSLTLGLGVSEDDADHLRLGVAASEWLAENRWREFPLREVAPRLSLGIHAQDGRGHFALTSHGTWSTGEYLPVGVLTHTADGHALAWQIETSAGWHMDLSQGLQGATLSLLGPTDLEHQFAHQLGPGQEFTAVPVAIAVSQKGSDAAIGELTSYRRWLRSSPADEELPVVYNDFMNTLMGQPSTDKLMPLIEAASRDGAEVFCIDAGWFADPALGDWWDSVGEWREATTRFTDGFKAVTDDILRRGMRVGLWLEPEVVGVTSPVATALPDEAFFHRLGQKVREHDRYHLDFRHPAVAAYITAVVDRVIRDYGVSYLKLDYNINPGVGTDVAATSAGDGLLGHTRAHRDWLIRLQQKHPGLQIENCSSGGMRADYALLSATHLQSTSDQQDFLLYPPIAASAPMSVLPEQCGNWAYPSIEMSDEETAFTLVSGLSGRLYLSGFLDRLRPAQRELIGDAVELHKTLRRSLPVATPFWPIGLPQWDDDIVCLGLHVVGGDLLFVWSRGNGRETLLPGVTHPVQQLFPRRLPVWASEPTSDGTRIHTPEGPCARVLWVAHEFGGAC